jgi:hypothetical protein
MAGYLVAINGIVKDEIGLTIAHFLSAGGTIRR